MVKTKEQLSEALRLETYPRSAKYDPEWVMENLMGPNVLWLTESLSQVMELRPGMRLLDMGCGTAISSIFLAKEFGVQVWATDLWVAASENWQRICAAGLSGQVFPIHAEAHALPFADDFFDAIVSLDAYHYFGTDDLYLGSSFVKLLKPGGQLGIHVPGLVRELPEELPEYLKPYWNWEFYSFHSPDWWRRHWLHTGMVEVEHADLPPQGWKDWVLWEELCAEQNARHDEREAEMLRVDAGRYLGFSRVVARRKVG